MTTEERYKYIYGNTAKELKPEPRELKKQKPKARKNKKRKKAPRAAFFSDGIEWRSWKVCLAILLLAAISLSYVYLNTQKIQLRKEIASMKTELNETKIENDNLESEINSQIDYNKIKKKAISKLGMKKPKADHIIKYGNVASDYVRQYGSIPE